jgi:spermidine synthase
MNTIYEVSDPLNPIIYEGIQIASNKSAFQEWCILDTEGSEHLFINNTLQSSKADEVIYHESFVHSLMNGCKKTDKVLILGGSEGCMAREVLKWPVTSVTQVDWDNSLVSYFRGPGASWNSNSYNDPRVNVVVADAFLWLKSCREEFDCIFIDLFDPNMDNYHDFYNIIKECSRCLSSGGGLSLNAGSVNSKASKYISLLVGSLFGNKELAAIHCPVPSFKEDWTFLMALPKLWSVLINEKSLPQMIYYNKEVLIKSIQWNQDLYPEFYKFWMTEKLTRPATKIIVDFGEHYGC